MKNFKENLDAIQKKAKERTVKTQTIEYDLETLTKKIDKNIIKLNPDYQRRHRWDDGTSSRLIESLILNIPIPIIYISQDIDVDEEANNEFSRYSVIDGQQRLTAISRFFNNKYPLSDLDVLKELNGAFYHDLPPFLIRRLEERSIRCLRIDSTVDTQVKYDIFERLNSGAVKLEAQELRNATCRGAFKGALQELAMNGDFKLLSQLKPESTRVKKMEDQELVLRFFSIAYKDGYKKYKGGFKDFLTENMNNFNNFEPKVIESMKKLFIDTMRVIRKTFGETPFAKYRVEKGELIEMSKFNSAVFDAIIVPFLRAVDGNRDITSTYSEFKELFRNNDYFSYFEGSVSDVKKINGRIDKTLEVVK